MSVLGRYKQQPGEKRKRGIDYTPFLEDNEEISTVVAAVTPTTATPFAVTTIVIDPDGKTFAYFAEGGEADTDYTVEFTLTTSLGQRLEDEIEFEIEEV
ncbi:MAG: hypothetical protein HC793_00700 [Aquincola sp.]|nr:hypothetical protein [Aquincola sp.]